MKSHPLSVVHNKISLFVTIYSATTLTGTTQGFLTNQKPIHSQRISTLWFSKPIKFNPKINLYFSTVGTDTADSKFHQ